MKYSPCPKLDYKTAEIPLKIEKNGVLLCAIKISQPVFSGEARPSALRRINQYYERFTKKLLRYADTKLRVAAEEQYKYSTENSFPFHSFDLRSDFFITFNEDGLISLYTDVYEYRGGAHGTTLRFADIWHSAAGTPASASEFFPSGTNYRKLLIDEAAKIAEERLDEGTALYFDSYKTLMRKSFSSANIYLTATGLALFYQQYAIAPYAEGIPVFIIPYNSETGPALPPCPEKPEKPE